MCSLVRLLCLNKSVSPHFIFNSRRVGDHHPSKKKKKMESSMSQKFTLVYASLLGAGGLMGYLKKGSKMSAVAGGGSAALFYYVYTELPKNPVLASSVGIVGSAALTGMMGSRYLRTRKVVPAGVVSIVSLVMAGTYLTSLISSS